MLTERSKRQSVSDSEGFGEGPGCLLNQIWGVIKRKAQIVMNSSNLSITLNMPSDHFRNDKVEMEKVLMTSLF